MRSAKILLSTMLILSVAVFAFAISLIVIQSENLSVLTKSQEVSEQFLKETKRSIPSVKPPPPAQKSSSAYVKTDALTTYTSDNGIVYLSYTPAWAEGGLAALNEELLKNAHGAEIDYVKEVRVYPGTERELVAGLQKESDAKYSLYLGHSALPQNFSVDFSATQTAIYLYNGDTKTNVGDMARTLSHEYGHHFTNYHIFSKLSPEEWFTSDYAKIRGMTSERFYTLITDVDQYMNDHMWYIQEVAAEDYVNLLGSKTVNQVYTYYDVKDKALASVRDQDVDDNFDKVGIAQNVLPQENTAIEFAKDVPGLNEYFANLAGTSPKTTTMDAREIEINIAKKVNTYNVISGSRNYTHYEVTWDTPYKSDDMSYTLVIYDENGMFRTPIKTVYGKNKGLAYIGNYAFASGDYIYSLDDRIPEGIKQFRVILMNGDGEVAVTPATTYDFGKRS